MLLSLILNQAVGAVLHIHGPADAMAQTADSVVHSHKGAGSTADGHHDSTDASDTFCCCDMPVSDCGTSTLVTANLMPVASHQSDIWYPTDFVYQHDYFPDLEPRPPRI